MRFSIKKIINSKTLVGFLFAAMVFSLVFVTIRMLLAPTVAPSDADVPVRIKGDYVLSILECAAGVAAMLLPKLMQKKAKISIPSGMFLAYALFLYCAIYLGTIRSFYVIVPQWDTILHAFSGAMLGALGFSLINFLNKDDKVPMNLSPVFVAFFAFCFALTVGVFWEVYEFVTDVLMDANMQKYALESGELLIGHEALVDTMKDLIVDALGAFVFATIGYVSIKYKKGWIERFQLKTEISDK